MLVEFYKLDVYAVHEIDVIDKPLHSGRHC